MKLEDISDLVVEDESVAAFAVDGGVGDVAEAAHVTGQELFGHRVGHAVQPHAVGRHRLAETQFHSRIAHLQSAN